MGEMEPGATDQSAQTIVVLNRDLFFGIRLNQLLKQLGYRVVLAKSQESFVVGLGAADVALGIIDINFGPGWDGIAQTIASGAQPPIIAFGPHLDIDGLRAAKKAGVTRVFSNGDFSKDTAAIVTRYARPAQQSEEIVE
jgi:FixJ family two-component response regulator